MARGPRIPNEPKMPNFAYIETENGLGDENSGLASDLQDDRQDERMPGGLLADVTLQVGSNFLLDDAPVHSFFSAGLLQGLKNEP